MKISVLSKEQIVVGISDKILDADPTSGTIAFAFTNGSDPVSGDWENGEWMESGGEPVVEDGEYLALCMVGPGSDHTKAAGTYTMWGRLTLSPEIVVRKIGPVRFE